MLGQGFSQLKSWFLTKEGYRNVLLQKDHVLDIHLSCPMMCITFAKNVLQMLS